MDPLGIATEGRIWYLGNDDRHWVWLRLLSSGDVKGSGKAGGVAPKAEWCIYYNGQKGCSRGDQCKFAHSDGRNGTRCSFFKGPGSCRDDSRCPFLHSQSAAL